MRGQGRRESLRRALCLFRASARLEWAHLRAQRFFVLLVILAAVSFLTMVSLFGLTGSMAPVALLNEDPGPVSESFIQALRDAHHSFALKQMNPTDAERDLRQGRLVGLIRIPADFSARLSQKETAEIEVSIDNVNVDLTNDVQRALPSAIVAFAKVQHFPGGRVEALEHDLHAEDTSYIAYLVVSALALDAMLIAGILGAMATAREWEKQTLKNICLSPGSRSAVLAGKLSVSATLASLALLIALSVIIFFYGETPVSLGWVLASLISCNVIFTCLGACLGSWLKRSMAVVPLLFGAVSVLYVFSGALEPIRLDGEVIWRVAHLSPIYYAVGVLQWAYHGLQVTPESVSFDFGCLLMLALGSWLLTLKAWTKRTNFRGIV